MSESPDEQKKWFDLTSSSVSTDNVLHQVDNSSLDSLYRFHSNSLKFSLSLDLNPLERRGDFIRFVAGWLDSVNP